MEGVAWAFDNPSGGDPFAGHISDPAKQVLEMVQRIEMFARHLAKCLATLMRSLPSFLAPVRGTPRGRAASRRSSFSPPSSTANTAQFHHFDEPEPFIGALSAGKLGGLLMAFAGIITCEQQPTIHRTFLVSYWLPPLTAGKGSYSRQDSCSVLHEDTNRWSTASLRHGPRDRASLSH